MVAQILDLRIDLGDRGRELRSRRISGIPADAGVFRRRIEDLPQRFEGVGQLVTGWHVPRNATLREVLQALFPRTCHGVFPFPALRRWAMTMSTTTTAATTMRTPMPVTTQTTREAMSKPEDGGAVSPY